MSKREIVYSDGSRGEKGDFPVAVTYIQEFSVGSGTATEAQAAQVVDPIFNGQINANLYGRIMTLVEATTDAYKLKAVKDLFSKELSSWADDVFHSAREITDGDDSTHNLYTRGSKNI